MTKTTKIPKIIKKNNQLMKVVVNLQNNLKEN